MRDNTTQHEIEAALVLRDKHQRGFRSFNHSNGTEYTVPCYRAPAGVSLVEMARRLQLRVLDRRDLRRVDLAVHAAIDDGSPGSEPAWCAWLTDR